MCGLAEQNDARIADSAQERLEICGRRGGELLCASPDGSYQRRIGLGICLAAPGPHGARVRRGVFFFAEDRPRAQILDVLDAKGLIAGADHAHQFEHLGVHAHRHDQAATDFQLLLQFAGYLRTGKVDQDRVERGVLGPSGTGLTMQDVHVGDVLALERGSGGERQPLHGFHGVHASGDPREHRGHVTGARADLEHLFAALEPQCLDHGADDAGAGDGARRGRLCRLGN